MACLSQNRATVIRYPLFRIVGLAANIAKVCLRDAAGIMRPLPTATVTNPDNDWLETSDTGEIIEAQS